MSNKAEEALLQALNMHPDAVLVVIAKGAQLQVTWAHTKGMQEILGLLNFADRKINESLNQMESAHQVVQKQIEDLRKPKPKEN